MIILYVLLLSFPILGVIVVLSIVLDQEDYVEASFKLFVLDIVIIFAVILIHMIASIMEGVPL